jgi:Tfp pilus assembly PilM family ATPase
VGIYSSAISVSQDVKLRQSIRKILVKESKLLDSIGTAEMQQEIQRRVMRITKKHQGSMEEETGVQSSLNEEDIKEYLDEVMQEIRAKK